MFLFALEGLSAITFDLRPLFGVFCVVEITFTKNLVFSTASLLVVVLGCFSSFKYRKNKASRKSAAKFALYACLFVVRIFC